MKLQNYQSPWSEVIDLTPSTPVLTGVLMP